MHSKSEILSHKRTLRAIYLVSFLFSLVVAIPAYIGSDFISLVIGKKAVGIIFALESIITIGILTAFSGFLRRFGNLKVSVYVLLAILFSVSGILFLKTPFIVILSFLVFLIAGSTFYLNLDILIENYTKNNATGGIRGIYMSISNGAWVIAPMIAGFAMSAFGHRAVFLLAGILTLPTILILILNFKNFKDSTYRLTPFIKLISALPQHPNTYKIWMTNFLLSLFYSWMVIYMPIYLHNNLGFDWRVIGFIFTLMLIPFVVLEAPLGQLADKRFGEKEMLSIGFIITGLGSIFLSLIVVPDFWLFASGLIITRIGASMIEIMNETYFFKKCGSSDSDIIGLFRMTRPIAYIVGPLVGSFFLLFTNYQSLFFILGLIMFFGLRYSLTLKDTK